MTLGAGLPGTHNPQYLRLLTRRHDDIPNARPLKSAKPSGTLATGKPASAATLAIRASAGASIAVTSCLVREVSIAVLVSSPEL